ncbi:MBL fold metallo-hydrolase [Nocardioides zeae]|uniref:MBL fold metallo-hydrolase n=1 Tax=Nocardioides imazamoxiresistens TaxID=3231893 RepID=A0ABU3PUL7_9ACTN|nr:MBL fold metallo-hydrolase [Nocardioides zeae]MDT9592923.1 MBL fold metallo-hydrolase [Nocardioides zeae]
MTPPRIQQVGRDAYLVTGTAVSWVVVREGRDVTLVDGGYPADADRLEASLAALGHRPEDVRAVLVTHAHVDQTGGVVRLHERHGTPVLAHPDELPGLRGERAEQATPLDVARRAWRPRVARWGLAVSAAGATRHPRLPDATAYALGDPLDLPGRPVPVPTPGHTSGHAAYLFAGGVLATGDALVTGHPLSRIAGPQLLPDFFTHDPAGADAALDRIAALDAGVLAPGHGPAWHGSLAVAVERARRGAPARLR